MVVVNKKADERRKSEDYFEIIDANNVLHRIPNWTDEEWNEFGLRSFFKTSEVDEDGIEVISDGRR